MKQQAENDLCNVKEYLKKNKGQCRSPAGLTEVRREAVKTWAKSKERETQVTHQTVHRHLKIALGIDLKYGIDKVDEILYKQLWDESESP